MTRMFRGTDRSAISVNVTPPGSAPGEAHDDSIRTDLDAYCLTSRGIGAMCDCVGDGLSKSGVRQPMEFVAVDAQRRHIEAELV